MAVASLELSYTYCFEQVEKAYDAIEQGEANKAASILCSIRDNAKLIQEQSEMYYKGLRRLQTAQQKRIENLTEEIHDLYNEEKRYSKQKRELGIQKQVYMQARESEEASKMAAERRYRDAERQKEKHLKEKRERDEKAKNFWWFPGYIFYLIFDDWMKDNIRKARDARREMEKHQNMIQEAEKEMEKLSYEEVKVKNEIKASEQKQCNTNEQRKSLHKKLGATKQMIVLLRKAKMFWDDIASLCDNASIKSENLACVMRSASGKMKNTVKMLRSRGTQTLVESFKDSWQEIEDMIRTNDLVIAEDCPAKPIRRVEFGKRGMATNSVESRTIILNTIGIAFVALFGFLLVIVLYDILCFVLSFNPIQTGGGFFLVIVQVAYLEIYSIIVDLFFFIAKIVGALYFIVYFIYIFCYPVYLLYVLLSLIISFTFLKNTVLLEMVTNSVESRTIILNTIALSIAVVALFGFFVVTVQVTYLTIYSIAVVFAFFIAKSVGVLFSIVYFIIYIFCHLVDILCFVLSFNPIQTGGRGF